ncbi:hypothetical protein [Streptomyces sp. NPDC005435]|uniref:hypothetical protein n=1 Tax=Streptomyces sp. NPDC005435 TaxID=3154464 RepID=UPI0034551EF9
MRSAIRPHAEEARATVPTGRCCGCEHDSVPDLARAGSFRVPARRTVHAEPGRDATWPYTESERTTCAARCLRSRGSGVADLAPVSVPPSPLTARIAKKASAT